MEMKKLNIDETIYETEVPDSYGKKWEAPNIKLLKAFIPGTIIEVQTSLGAKVQRGDILLILDAMKMFNEITAPVSGTIKQIAVTAGERVEKNQLLVEIG